MINMTKTRQTLKPFTARFIFDENQPPKFYPATIYYRDGSIKCAGMSLKDGLGDWKKPLQEEKYQHMEEAPTPIDIAKEIEEHQNFLMKLWQHSNRLGSILIPHLDIIPHMAHLYTVKNRRIHL